MNQQEEENKKPENAEFNIDKIDAESVAIGPGATVNNYFIQSDTNENSPSIPQLSYEPQTTIIPAGSFLMGDAGVSNLSTAHTVDLPEYAMGIYPVTNQQFSHFILKTGRVAAKELLWDGNKPTDNQLMLPVTGVTWYDAIAYCKWLSAETQRPYSLPNEAQWEKAARGTDGRLYPWGNEWEHERCNSDPERVTAVDTFPLQSIYGCYDMVGNGREWTTTLWGTDAQIHDARYQPPWADDGRDVLDALPAVRRVFKSGRGKTDEAFACANRGSYLPNRSGPRRNRHGFRVVLKLA